jgi:hypothetical protein
LRFYIVFPHTYSIKKQAVKSIIIGFIPFHMV